MAPYPAQLSLFRLGVGCDGDISAARRAAGRASLVSSSLIHLLFPHHRSRRGLSSSFHGRCTVAVHTRYAIMIQKGYRLSLSHLFFYITSFIIATQLWSIWRQSSTGYSSYLPSAGDWHFETDVHANVHTLSHEQCDSAFPELYDGLDKAVARRAGRKVHIQDIEIRQGRCMMRVMIYQGEVCATHPFSGLTCADCV
jgi:hypothetical protein